MTDTVVTSTASGSTDTFSIPFPYIDEAHVKVYLDGVLQVQGVDYTFPNASNIQFVDGNVTAGVAVRRQRVTPSTALTTFAAGELDEDDLNNAYLQTRYVAEEAADLAALAEETANNINVDLDAIAAAAGHAEDAADAATLAEAWAETAEDTEVPGNTGQYSALHWAAKAAASAASIIDNLGGIIHGLTTKATPALTDEVGLASSVDGFAGRRSTVQSIRDLYKTYFDTVYQSISGMSSYQTVAAMSGYVPVPDIVAAAPSANQNDYAPGLASSKAVSYLNLSPTVSIILTGLSTSGWAAGKTVVIRNATSRTGSDGRFILIPRSSSSSSAANRFQYPGNKKLPILLLPGESAEFYFDGTDLKLIRWSRGLTLRSFFDHCFDGNTYWDPWTSGSGAGGGYAAAGTDENSEPYSRFTVSTGTTTTGRSALVDNDNTHRAGAGPLLFLSRVNIPTLADGTNDFDVMLGFTETGATPLDQICWLYDRSVSTDWQFKTNNNGTPTAVTVTGLTVATGAHPLLGLFVNGDGSRVEAFYSTDGGETWTIHGTAITTNIPNSTARIFGMGAAIIKSAGTTSRSALIGFAGAVGWL